MDEKQLLASIVNMLEKQQNELGEIRAQLNEQGAKLDAQGAKLDKVQINQESVIMPQLGLLFEGHTSILQKIDRDQRIQDLQDSFDTLDRSVKYLGSEIKHLKKAE